jgi:hypothetical protein
MKIPLVVAKMVLENAYSLAAVVFPSSPFKYVSTESKSFPLIVQEISSVALRTFTWTEG